MTEQAWITLALVIVGAIQGAGVWQRVIEARRTNRLKQHELDFKREEFEYKKELNESNNRRNLGKENHVSFM
jgi:hypothetical protein